MKRAYDFLGMYLSPQALTLLPCTMRLFKIFKHEHITAITKGQKRYPLDTAWAPFLFPPVLLYNLASILPCPSNLYAPAS